MKYVYLISLMLLAGCGTLIPTDHKEQVTTQSTGKLASQQSADISKQSEAPPVTVSITGKDNKLDLKMEGMKTQTTVKADVANDSSGTDHASGRSSTVIPIVIKIAIGLFCLIVLLGIIWYCRKQFVAVDAAFKAGDDVIANLINKKRLEAMKSTNAQSLVEINADIAHMEQERGKFNAA